MDTETLSTRLTFTRRQSGMAAKMDALVMPRRDLLAAEIAKRMLDKHNARPDDAAIMQAAQDIARELGDRSDSSANYTPPEGELRFIGTLRIVQEAPRVARTNARQLAEGHSYNVWRHATDRVFDNAAVLFPSDDPTKCEIPADIADYYNAIAPLTRKAIKAEQAYRKTAEGRYEQARWNFEQLPLQALPAGAKETITELIDRAVDVAVERALAAHGVTEEEEEK